MAWFDDGSPDTFGGPDAFAAIRRLLKNSPARHRTLDHFEPDLEECRLNQVVIVLIDQETERGVRAKMSRYPECQGTGNSFGLNHIETCRMCGGVRAGSVSRYSAFACSPIRESLLRSGQFEAAFKSCPGFFDV